MILLEQSEAAEKRLDIKIFGSDINEHSLKIARTGVYPREIQQQVSYERLRRFFDPAPNGYQVKKRLRDLVVFAQQSLIADSPFSKLDLITCRNVLIYLEPVLQRQILRVFHFALWDQGYLFLGNAESAAGFEAEFRPVSKKWRIFQRLETPRGMIPAPTGGEPVKQAPHDVLARALEPSPLRITSLAQQLVLERFAPASVLVNRNFEILYYCGPTHQYLINPTGVPTHNLLDMARSGLRTKLRSAIHKTTVETGGVTVSDVRVRRGNKYVAVTIRVSPVRTSQDGGELYLVVFEDQKRSAIPREKLSQLDSEVHDEDALVRQLEYDLKITREDLQANLEELETANEELKATNEEMTSMNEELQSANEELETSKEELQSLNEELSTVNNQLQIKIEELESTNTDLENLLTSTEMATIFLDRELRVRRYTPAMKRLINLTATMWGGR
jgi:two-component system CheB/CheR fusion protein